MKPVTSVDTSRGHTNGRIEGVSLATVRSTASRSPPARAASWPADLCRRRARLGAVEIVGPGHPAHLRVPRPYDRHQFPEAGMADLRGGIDEDGVMPAQCSPDQHLTRPRSLELRTHPRGIIAVKPLLGLLDTHPLATERGHPRPPLDLGSG